MRIIQQILKHKAVPTLVSAALMQLAFAPMNLFLLVFVALVPWLHALSDTDRRGAWRSGLLFGTVFWLVQCWWIVPFVGRWTGSVGMALIPWLLIPLLVVWFFGLLGIMLHACIQRDWLLAIPLAWGGIEALRSTFPGLAFPWGLLASPLTGIPWLIQNASYGEVFFVSAWVALVNVIVWQLFQRPDRQRLMTPILVCAALLLLSVVRYSREVVGDRVVVTIGQPGVDLAFGDPASSNAKALQAAREIVAQASGNGSRFIVLPEGIAAQGADISPGATVPVLYGGVREESGKSHQSAFVRLPSGEVQWADKTRLVMFGEYVPFRRQLSFLKGFNLPSADLSPGATAQSIEIAGLRGGALLCFEGLFPDVARKMADQGSRFLAIMSIDDWYAGTPAIPQLADGAIWRSIETGLPTLRSASTGVSRVIDAKGHEIVRAPLGANVAMRAEVVMPAGSDTFRFRHFFGWFGLLVGLGALLLPKERP
ncbi:MAG: apolipoprotein N-acyltransferase [Chthonomonas sp.]|nr:apolipoprotein N-acyltransferase [Chthonomonas sp.]